jgi:hypothetical protein
MQIKLAGMSYMNLSNEDDESVASVSLPKNLAQLLNKKKKINLLNSIREKTEHLLMRKK